MITQDDINKLRWNYGLVSVKEAQDILNQSSFANVFDRTDEELNRDPTFEKN